VRARLLAALPLAVMVGLSASCSLGQGVGTVVSEELFAHDCWGTLLQDGTVKGEPYDLQPDFFAANPYRSTMQIRVQRGNDLTEVSDGLSILIDDVPAIRKELNKALIGGIIGAGSTGGAGGAGGTGGAGGVIVLGNNPTCDEISTRPGVTYQVALPPGVTPPGSPSVPPDDLLHDPPIVHMALYLQRSCHNQNSILYAVSGKITFTALFNGDPNEKEAAEKLTEAIFEVKVGDLRDVPLGAYPRDIPTERQTTLKGCFRFYFERGQPGQPFP